MMHEQVTSLYRNLEAEEIPSGYFDQVISVRHLAKEMNISTDELWSIAPIIGCQRDTTNLWEYIFFMCDVEDFLASTSYAILCKLGLFSNSSIRPVNYEMRSDIWLENNLKCLCQYHLDRDFDGIIKTGKAVKANVSFKPVRGIK